MKRALHLTALPVLLLVSTANPATADEFDRSGVYLGVGGTGAVHLVQDAFETALGPGSELSASAGVNARLGYRVVSWFAIEAQYEWVHGFDASTGISGDRARLSAHTITADLKFILPTWRIQPYLLLGPGASHYQVKNTADLASTLSARLTSPLAFLSPSFGPPLLVQDSSEWAVAGRVGVGLDAYITRNVLLNLEVSGVLTANNFDAPAGLRGLSPLHYLSTQLGIQYRF